jgi:hypothetical protein
MRHSALVPMIGMIPALDARFLPIQERPFLAYRPAAHNAGLTPLNAGGRH